MKALMAGSRPEPTPSTITSASLTPSIAALLPMTSPTLEAAKGVPFFAPLKPKLPELDQKSVLPDLSEKRTLVLTIANPYALQVASGNSLFSGDIISSPSSCF